MVKRHKYPKRCVAADALHLPPLELDPMQEAADTRRDRIDLVRGDRQELPMFRWNGFDFVVVRTVRLWLLWTQHAFEAAF